ncbi:MAG: helix-turn-helix transcriptional regulator [Terracidiphilus sp.]
MQTAHNGDRLRERCIYPNLKLRMYTTGMRQNRLAKLLGIDEAYLSRIINGVRVPRQPMRVEIAKALGSDVEWLFEQTRAEAAKNLMTLKTEIGQDFFGEN